MTKRKYDGGVWSTVDQDHWYSCCIGSRQGPKYITLTQSVCSVCRRPYRLIRVGHIDDNRSNRYKVGAEMVLVVEEHAGE